MSVLKIPIRLKQEERDRLESYLQSNNRSQRFHRYSNVDNYQCYSSELGIHSVSLSRNPDDTNITVNFAINGNMSSHEHEALIHMTRRYYQDIVNDNKRKAIGV